MKKSMLKGLVLSTIAAGVFAFGGLADAAIHVNPIPGISPDFIKGADVSMTPAMEQLGAKFYDIDGKQMDEFDIMKKYGINWIRLRIWNNPSAGQGGGGETDEAKALAMTKRAHEHGMKVLIDFHYSDWWADPGKQYTPKAWQGHDKDQLKKDIYDYTKKVLGDFKAAGETPEMVQVGNEITNGICWPVGKFAATDDGKTLAELLQSGLQAVHDSDPGIKTMLHLDNGGNNWMYENFFDKLITNNGVNDFDVIGLSYYPFWSGTMDELANNLNAISKKYNKDVIVVETSFGWSNKNFDNMKNPYAEKEERVGGFRSTVQGQATGLRTLMDRVSKVPGGKGLGVFYWAPDSYPVKGAGSFANTGDEWDNLCMFDPNGKALESWQVWNDVSNPKIKTIQPTVKSLDTLPVETGKGQPARMPDTVRVTYSDDHAVEVPMTWKDASVFQKPGKYTVKSSVKVDGKEYPVKTEVNVVNKVNVVKNGDFEDVNLNGWTISGDQVVDAISKNGDSIGKGSLHYWSDKAFAFTVSQKLTGLKDGKYTAAVSTQGGGGQSKYQLYVKTGGQDYTADIQDTKWNDWHTFTIKDIVVKDGKAEIGVAMNAAPGT